MSVTMALKAIHDEDLAVIRNDGDLTTQFLFGHSAKEKTQKGSFFSRLLGKEKARAPARAFKRTPVVSFGKHYEILLYAFSGPGIPVDDPFDVMNGKYETIAEVDFGYGLPYLIPATRLADLRSAIDRIDGDQIGRYLNLDDMTKANIFERDDVLENLEQWTSAMREKLAELRAFASYCEENQTSAVAHIF